MMPASKKKGRLAPPLLPLLLALYDHIDADEAEGRQVDNEHRRESSVVADVEDDKYSDALYMRMHCAYDDEYGDYDPYERYDDDFDCGEALDMASAARHLREFIPGSGRVLRSLVVNLSDGTLVGRAALASFRAFVRDLEGHRHIWKVRIAGANFCHDENDDNGDDDDDDDTPATRLVARCFAELPGVDDGIRLFGTSIGPFPALVYRFLRWGDVRAR
jgi:hypothetical protein